MKNLFRNLCGFLIIVMFTIVTSIIGGVYTFVGIVALASLLLMAFVLMFISAPFGAALLLLFIALVAHFFIKE